jgi:hypothetical protein
VSLVPVEQTVYARWLDRGTRIGLWLLIATFAAYALGLVPPQVELARLPQVWHLPADRYQALTGAPTGWGWLGLLHKGDYLNLLAVSFLSLTTVVCYLRILSIHLRRGERLVAAMILAQVLVLLVAASGALAGGH